MNKRWATRKERYEQLYKASKTGGEPFFPHAIAKDVGMAVLVVFGILTLAAVFPAVSEPPADPTSTNYVPRPEWYFLFFFEFLKLFPGNLEAVAAIFVPAAFIALMFLIPFFDRDIERSWSYRKLPVGLGIAFVLFILTLVAMGLMSAPEAPAVAEDPRVLSGTQVYRQRNCSYCHAINGVGGAVGRDLSDIGARMNAVQVAGSLRDPTSEVMQALHPKLLFTEPELEDLSAYLATLGAQVPFSPEAVPLTEQRCQGCHQINGQGGAIGPDLSGIGSRRTLNFIENFVISPSSVSPGATMPAFRDVLTPAQIHDIAAYLFSLRQPIPTPKPALTPPPVPTGLR